MADYTPLNNQTVLDYVRSRPALSEIFGAAAHLSAVEIGDGNLNQVFIVKSDQGQASCSNKPCPICASPGTLGP